MPPAQIHALLNRKAYLVGEGPVTGLIRYIGVSGVGRRRVRRFDERVVPARGAGGSLRHDAEVRETAMLFRAAKEEMDLRGFEEKIQQSISPANEM